MSGLSKGDRVY